MSEPEGYHVSVKLVENLQFLGMDGYGHSVIMDAAKEGGGASSGFSPSRLMLIALGGCSGMDVANILRKRRQNITSLQVLVKGNQVQDYPRYFNEIHMKYIVKGKDVDKKSLEVAIRLSNDAYCSVGATLGGRANITTSYEIITD